MPAPLAILILGGTGEASALAALLAGDPRFAPVLSLAGRTASPAPSPVPRRIGGFGGADGLARHLAAHRVEALVDATHPFAAAITANAARAAEAASVPLLRVRRPAWIVPGAAGVADAAAAAAALGPVPRRVLLTVGRQDLAPFRDAPHHAYVARSIEAPDPASLPAGTAVLRARPPFDLAHELETLAAHRIERLVAKNSGGAATAAKFEAARRLGVGVVLIARPAEPATRNLVETAHQARSWLEALLAAPRGEAERGA